MRVVNLPTLYSSFNKAQRCFGCFFRFYCAFKAINVPVLFADCPRSAPHGVGDNQHQPKGARLQFRPLGDSQMVPTFLQSSWHSRVPFANVRESLADGTWKVPATF